MYQGREHHRVASSNYEKPPMPQTAGLYAASKLLSKHFQSNSTSRRENSNVMNTTSNSLTVASSMLTHKMVIDHRVILDEMSSQR